MLSVFIMAPIHRSLAVSVAALTLCVHHCIFVFGASTSVSFFVPYLATGRNIARYYTLFSATFVVIEDEYDCADIPSSDTELIQSSI